MKRLVLVAALAGTGAVVLSCAGDAEIVSPDALPTGSAPLATVVSSVALVSDQASCSALPVSTTWASANCIVNEDLTFVSGGGLRVEDVRVTVAKGVTVTNDGGTITVVSGGLLRIAGVLANTGGGSIQNNGFWDLRDGGAVVNSAGSTILTSNQLHVTQGTLGNAGSLTNTATLSIALTATVTNEGTLTNSGTIPLDGLLQNVGTINNNGAIALSCSGRFVAGTLIGNAADIPFCWVGGHGGLWSTAGNWSTNSVPTSAGRILIFSTSSPTLDVAFTLTGTLTLQLATLVIGTTGSLTNEGTIRLGLGGQYPGTAVIRNDGTLTNNSSFINNDLLVNRGTVVNNDVIQPGSVVGVVENSGVFTNAAGAFLEGGLRGLAGGSFNNYGQVNLNRSVNSNAGVVANFAAATLNVNNALANNRGGRIENHGTLNITHALTSPARIDNAAGATIVNRGVLGITAAASALNNKGLVEHTGTMNNAGIVQNDAIICGGGAITGNAVLGNAPRALCNRTPVAHVGGPYDGDEGNTISLALSGADPDGDALMFTWDLGDGTTGSSATPPTSHAYVDDGSYTITLTVSDGAESASASTTAIVANVAPAATFAAPGSVDEGGSVTLALISALDPGGADVAAGFSYAFDCGDASGYGAFGSAATATCAAPDNTTLDVRASIRDKDGAVSEYTAAVDVVNVAPAVTVSVPAQVYSGDAPVLNASFSDPGPDAPWTWSADWGFATDAGTLHQVSGFASSPRAFVPGMYTILVTVTDEDGARGGATAGLEVLRLPVGMAVNPRGGEEVARINLNSRGVTTTALLTDGAFDASSADVTTILAGPGSAPATSSGPRGALADVDGDADLDLLLSFETAAIGLDTSATQLCLTGRTTTGVHFVGCDAIRVTGDTRRGRGP